MHLVRTTAIIVLLQGLLALLALRTGGAGVFLFTAIYVLLATGIWHAEKWAWWLGIALTTPQVVLVSSWTVSWSFFVGATFGFGVQEPTGESPHLLGFGLHGVQPVVSHFGYHRALSISLTPGYPVPFFGLNLMAVYMLVLLVLCWRRSRRPRIDGE